LNKLGVFDSGIGGLTVYRGLRDALPSVSILYFGDTARVPYGTKSSHTVTGYSLQIARHLVGRGVDAVVVACNTASAYAMEALQSEIDVPVYGVVIPGAMAAVEATRAGVVGVVGTRGTVFSGAYQKALGDLDPSVRVEAVPCPLFVPLVEEGWLDDTLTLQVAERYLAPLVDAGVDTIVLGCTHYPMLKGVISRVVGDEVVLIDSAEAVSMEVRNYMRDNDLLDSEAVGVDYFEVTDGPGRFADVGRIFLDRDIDDVSLVELGE
jgi:glutamate racemase